jgi:hypothetical protein
VRETGGLEYLVGIIKDKSIRENKQLLAAATGAIWMCAKTNANVKRLDQVIVCKQHKSSANLFSSSWV